jgi:6,7-dimethyl-8-ribityllumazine synthase
MRTLEGPLDGAGLHVAVVVSRFNELITERLLDGALSTARECGVAEDALEVVWVPGAFELPTAARWVAQSQRYDAIACVGAVIRGETPHFEFVAGEAARGIAEVAREFDLPVTFGVITSDTLAQAQARAGGTVGNKGREAMLAAIEMANLRPLVEAPPNHDTAVAHEARREGTRA